MLAYAHVGNDLNFPPGHIPDPYVQPLSVPEASSPRGGLLRSAVHQKSLTRPGFDFYVKINYAEQLLTSYQNQVFTEKIMEE